MVRTEINKLLSYSRYLNKIRSKGSFIKKFYYFFLYSIVIPLFRIFRNFLGLFFTKDHIKNCDILVLGTCERDLVGSSHIWNQLTEKGYKVERTYIRKKSDFFRFAIHCKPLSGIPSSLYLQACAARYFTERYQPKMLITFYSYDVLPSFLRNEMNGKGPLVYMSHAVIPTTYIYTSFDYDYYLIFGKSSYENIQAQKIRIGHTKAICTGSPMTDKNFTLPPADPANRTLLYFSNWLIGEDPDYTRDFEIVKEWASSNPDCKLLIKLHPLERNGFVLNTVKGLGNVSVFKPTVTLKEAVSQASVTIVSFSVASLESALLNRPVVVANFRPVDSNSTDARVSDNFLHLEKYFPERAKNSDELSDRIKELFSHYDYYLEQAKKFTSYNLEYGIESGEQIVSLLETIFHGKEPILYYIINEKIEELK
jgi:hypothetical protein